MPKRRCAHCNAYGERNEMITKGIQAFCSLECVIEHATERRPVGNAPPSGGAGRRSKKAKTYDAEFQKARKNVLQRSRGKCEARIPGICSHLAEHVHHALLRSQAGSNAESNLLALCNNCHSHVHSHPQWSYEHGFLRHSWDKEAVASSTIQDSDEALIEPEKKAL